MERLVWIDCEMTGLDPRSDLLLEVACLVTDSDLAVLGEGVDIVIATPAADLERMGDFVRAMHTESGLLVDLATASTTMEQAEDAVLAYIAEHVPDPARTPLCGNSIGTDRTFLAAYMPRLDAALHYRMVDVSSVKELARRWYPKAYYASPAKSGGHRALADIRESVQELRYYRETVFVAPPGPDAATAVAVAARLLGESRPQEVPDVNAAEPPPA